MRRWALWLFCLMLLGSANGAVAERDGFFSVLLIGQDTAAEESVKGAEVSYGRADAILLAVLDRQQGEARLLSIDRDYRVDAADGGVTKLSLVHVGGGPEALVSAVNALLSLEVERYAMVDKAAMGAIVEGLGGIELYVGEAEREALGLKAAGRQRLTAQQAVDYASLRDRGSDGDIDRNERQRAVLKAAMDEVSARGMAGMMALAETLLPLVDTNLTLLEILGVGGELLTAGLPGLAQGRTPEAADRVVSAVKGHSVVTAADMAAEVRRVHAFLYGTP